MPARPSPPRCSQSWWPRAASRSPCRRSNSAVRSYVGHPRPQSSNDASCRDSAAGSTLPLVGRHRRPSAAVLDVKNADAKHRLCAERSESERGGGPSGRARHRAPCYTPAMTDAPLTPIEIGLTAAIVAMEEEEPAILVAGEGAKGEAHPADTRAGLPSGPFDPLAHRTFEIGLRA